VAFLDITQAFDKVWHPGLLFKIRKILPHAYYRILESYLTDRLFQVKFKHEIITIRITEAGLSQGSVLGPVLCDLATSDNTTTATFADVTVILAIHEDPAIASMKLQVTIDDWVKKWRIKINQSKSTLRNQTSPTVQMGNVDLPQKNEVKYLGMHLDGRLTWAKHIKTERKQLNLKAKQMHWLHGRSTLSIESKLLCKAVLKPIWTYGIQL
jgi:hypothetical protein